MSCFSFHSVKPITTSEEGMVTTNSEDLYKCLVLFRSHGIAKDQNMIAQNQGDGIMNSLIWTIITALQIFLVNWHFRIKNANIKHI